MDILAFWRLLGMVSLLSLATACAGGDAPTPTSAAVNPAAPAAAPVAPALAASPAAGAKPGVNPWEMPGAGLVKGPLEGDSKQLTGAGATFPAPLYTKWFSEYAKLAGVEVNYQSIGSGGGIKAITDGTADFGASDGPMTDEQLAAAKGDILHIPMTLGAVVATYNLPGLEQTRLKFNGDTLAGIFLGDIKKWNDAAIAADNAGVSLPDKEIVVVHRSDGSGTSFIWTDYLSSTNDKWKNSVGKSTSVNWPTGLGAKGNEGVSGEIKQNPFSIGYVELAYAIQNKLPIGQIKNKSGQFVDATLDSTTAAAAGVSDNLAPDLRVSIVNPASPTAYPIASFTWLLVRRELQEPSKAQALTRLVWWTVHDGQKMSAELLYAPLPVAVVQKDEEKIKSMTVNGKPAFPGR